MSSLLPPWAVASLMLIVGVPACSQVDRVNFPLNVQKQLELATASEPVAVAWSPDGSRITAAIDYGDTIAVWDSTGRQLSRFTVGSGPNFTSQIAFLNGASRLVFAPPRAAGESVVLSVRNSATGRVVQDAPRPQYADRLGFSVADDQSLLAIQMNGLGFSGFDVGVFDTHDWKIVRQYVLEKGAASLNFFAMGRKLVVGSNDALVAVGDLTSGDPPRELHAFDESKSVSAVAGSPDGALIFVGSEGVSPARVLRTADGGQVAAFPMTAVHRIGCAEWDPKGRYIAFTDEDALFIWRWSASGPSYERFEAPNAIDLAISQDGAHIAVAVDSGVVVYSVR